MIVKIGFLLVLNKVLNNHYSCFCIPDKLVDLHRALRVLNSANVILSEDTRHSGKLLHHYNIKTPLVSDLWALIWLRLVVVCEYKDFLMLKFRFSAQLSQIQ